MPKAFVISFAKKTGKGKLKFDNRLQTAQIAVLSLTYNVMNVTIRYCIFD